MRNYLNRLLEPKDNGPEIALQLISLLNVKISASTVTPEIEGHPDYPSLLSVSDVLNNYGIDTVGIKFDVDKFTEIPAPFITQIRGAKTSKSFFTVIKAFDTDIVHYFDPEKHQWERTHKADFLKICSGVALLAEASEGAGEKDYENIQKKEKQKNNIYYFTALSIPAIVLIAGIMNALKYGAGSFLPFLFTFLTLIGTAVTALLLWYELDQHNPVLQQICRAGKKVNCKAVLESGAAKIAGISWSTIGFSYFTGILLLLLFSGMTSTNVLAIVSIVNMLALPYVAFSVFYQWRIAKQWCMLCLCVQIILILQFGSILLGHWYNSQQLTAIDPNLFISGATAFVIPFLVTSLLLPAQQKAKDHKRVNTELQRLKHNSQIFEALLQKQKEVSKDPKGLGIILGNPNAAYKLIKVCNPYCAPCGRAHQPMEDLLHNNPDVQIQILFNASNSNDDIKTPPVKHFLSIAANNGEAVVKQALSDWYLAESKDYESFASRYPMNGESDQSGAQVEAMKVWCDQIGIEFTPTFFISMPGDDESKYFQLPSVYNVKDLKYFFSI